MQRKENEYVTGLTVMAVVLMWWDSLGGCFVFLEHADEV